MQLLSTNNELLSFMFDKMFKNPKKPTQQRKGERVRSQNDITEAIFREEEDSPASPDVRPS